MKNKKVKLIAVLLLGIGLSGLQAQVAIVASGGTATGSGTVSYSVGQVVYTVITNSGSVAQGVQQPYEISVVTGLETAKGISLEINVYPNPATDYLKLKIDGEVKTQCIASLYDINGNLLHTIKVESNETTIVMGNYVSSTYFLKVTDNNKEIKTFKIIKN
ncbi:MAG: T9SS type A sorting domain-containing protein [Bacteroidia bacterium]|nr:T9SS type A sorting domain-containing protein [Bacteroidia bacterium]